MSATEFSLSWVSLQVSAVALIFRLRTSQGVLSFRSARGAKRHFLNNEVAYHPAASLLHKT